MSERSPTDETGGRKSKEERPAAKERAEKPLVNEGHGGDVDKEMQRFCSELKDSEKKRRETSGQVDREMEQFAREDSTKERTAGQGGKKTTLTGVRETAGPDSVKGQAVPDLRHERSTEAGQPRPDTTEKLTDSSSERVALPNSRELTEVHAPTTVPENPQRSEARKPERLPEGVPTQDELDLGIERHVYLEDRDFHRVQLKEARAYIELKESGPKSEVELRRFAESHDLPLKKVTDWDSDARVPKLIELIRNQDYYRARYEQTLSPAAKERCIDPSTAYEAFRELREVKDPKPEQIAECIQKLAGGLDESHRIVYCRLYPYAPGGPMWMNELGHQVGEKREEIQRALNERLGLHEDLSREVRVGISGHRLYLWLKDTSSDNWMNHYRNENFHFKDIAEKRALIEKTASSLGINGTVRLSRLVAQVTEYPKATSDFNPNIDLKYNNSRFRGETLQFAMDTLSLSNADIESKIDHIGRGKRGWGVIRNPLLTGIVETPLCTLVSVAKSDCHIDPRCHIAYSDRSTERVLQVKGLVNKLGEVDCSIKYHKITGTPYLHIPAVVGRLLVDLGITPGDKAILNEGLPPFVTGAKPQGKIAYIRELGSDDASFDIEKEYDRGSFQWTRSVVLHAGVKSEMYGHTPLVSEDLVDLVRRRGTRKGMTFGYEGEPHKTRLLRIGEIKRLAEQGNPDDREAAKALLEAIHANPSRLLESERQLCADLGIRTRRYPIAVRYFEKTKRVSVAWQGHSATREDTLKWARIALPSHPDKRDRIEAWIHLMETQYVRE